MVICLVLKQIGLQLQLVPIAEEPEARSLTDVSNS